MDQFAVSFKDNFAPEDSVLKKVEEKVEILNAIKGIFDSCNTLKFNAKNIYQDNQTTIVEFVLKLDDFIYPDIDKIEWEPDSI